MSKLATCRQIATSNPTATRKELMAMFQQQFPTMSNATASSYASSVRNDSPAQAAVVPLNVPQIQQETDEEIHTRLEESFGAIKDLSEATCNGHLRSLIVSGKPGTGKSYSVEKALKEYDPQGIKSALVSGFARATGLYLLLHEYRNEGDVLVLDDLDSIFSDETALNLLKAALDTTHKRIISWRSETKMVDHNGEPVEREFEYKGSIIFLTNLDFDEIVDKNNKMSPHLAALQSRSSYVNTSVRTTRDCIIRIKQVAKSGMLAHKGININQEKDIIQFIEDNADKFRELTLRLVIKLADLYLLDKNKFESLARISLFKPQRYYA